MLWLLLLLCYCYPPIIHKREINLRDSTQNTWASHAKCKPYPKTQSSCLGLMLSCGEEQYYESRSLMAVEDSQESPCSFPCSQRGTGNWSTDIMSMASPLGTCEKKRPVLSQQQILKKASVGTEFSASGEVCSLRHKWLLLPTPRHL